MIVNKFTQPTPGTAPWELNAAMRLPSGKQASFIVAFAELVTVHGGKLQASELRMIEELSEIVEEEAV